jgi:HEAT repeat protein
MNRLIVASLITACSMSPRASADEQQAIVRPGRAHLEQYSVQELIEQLDGPQESFPNGPMGDPPLVQTHLGIYRLHYSADNGDEPALLAAMLDEERSLDRRLLLASFLLDLNNERARQLIVECLDGQHGDEMRTEATYALVNEEALPWRHRQIVRLLEQGRSTENYDAAWDALCNRAGELKLTEAVDTLIAALRRHPGDGDASSALAAIGETRAIPVILPAIGSDNPQDPFREEGVHEIHLYALQKLNAPQLPAILLKHLDDPLCVDMLADLGLVEAVEPLTQKLAESQDDGLKRAIRSAVFRLTAGSRHDLADRLLQVIEASPTLVDMPSAIAHVAATGQQWAIPRLAAIAKSTDDYSTVHASILAIGRLGGDGAVTELLAMVDHDFSHVRLPAKRNPAEDRTYFHPLIAIALRDATGDDLGRDPQAWRQRPHR